MVVIVLEYPVAGKVKKAEEPSNLSCEHGCKGHEEYKPEVKKNLA